MIEEAVQQGLRTLPQCSPITMSSDFTMHNCQIFKGVPSWHEVLLSKDDY